MEKEKVLNCIFNHRSSKNATNIEELCVCDADILAHFDNIPMLFNSAFNRNNVKLEEIKSWLKACFEKDYNGKIIRPFLGIEKAEIEKLKLENTKQNEELTLVCFGLSACLDGLIQLGCNHTVTTAKDKLDKYINNMAHKQL